MSNPIQREKMRGNRLAKTKLTEFKVRQIRRLYASGNSQTSIAATFDVHPTTVYDICKRLTWKHVE